MSTQPPNIENKMAPRRRGEKRRNFPANLYEVGGYYSWRNPNTDEHLGIGRVSQREAFEQAIEANEFLKLGKKSLVERLQKPAQHTWGKWLDEYWKLLQKRKGRKGKPLAANTLKTYKSLLVRARQDFDEEQAAADIDTMAISKVIDSMDEAGISRTAQSFRSFLFDCFRVCIQKGWRKDNPVAVTDRVSVGVKRARLTFEVFMALYKTTGIVELRNAMALAIVSGQARENCVGATFKQMHDGHWWNERGKTGARVRIPLELRLDCFGMSLTDVIRQCRTTGIVSPYLIHRTTRAKGATLGHKVHPDTLTRMFTDELAKLGLSFDGKEPPTFHEIRSLAERLYIEQGDVNTQDLLAHKEGRSTAIYHDPRGEWIQVSIKK